MKINKTFFCVEHEPVEIETFVETAPRSQISKSQYLIFYIHKYILFNFYI